MRCDVIKGLPHHKTLDITCVCVTVFYLSQSLIHLYHGNMVSFNAAQWKTDLMFGIMSWMVGPKCVPESSGHRNKTDALMQCCIISCLL